MFIKFIGGAPVQKQFYPHFINDVVERINNLCRYGEWIFYLYVRTNGSFFVRGVRPLAGLCRHFSSFFLVLQPDGTVVFPLFE